MSDDSRTSSARLPVRMALSEFFLDTELEAIDYKRIGDVLAPSPDSTAELREILRFEVYPVCIWNLRQVACSITGERQFVALVIGVLEPATEDPVAETDIDGLMRFLSDDRASRAVFYAYERTGFPADLFRHHGEYAARCRQRGEVPVPMNLTALARWMHES